MDPAVLKAKVTQAKVELDTAETELEGAITALKQGTRADKTIVTATMGSALSNLRRARTQLADLEEAIEK